MFSCPRKKNVQEPTIGSALKVMKTRNLPMGLLRYTIFCSSGSGRINPGVPNVCRSRDFGVSDIGFHGERSEDEIIFKIVPLLMGQNGMAHTEDGCRG
jgi:hypothetical protein